jgi:hypothetical protein
MVNLIEDGVALFFGGGFLTALGSVVSSLSFGYLPLLLFAVGGTLVAVGLRNDLKATKK